MKPSIRISLARLVIHSATIFSAIALSVNAALAQGYPEKPIKVIVAWPAGGIADVTTRVVTQHLSTRLQQPIIIETRTGANGIIGAELVAKSAPDGYTLLFASAEANSINPHIYPKLPYDPLRDFAAIAPFVKVNAAFAGRVGMPATSAKEVVALAQSQPSKLTYGSWGIGSIGHIGMEMLAGNADLKMLHVPFQGGPPAFTALMGGQIDLMLIPAPAAIPLRNSGKIKVFGVTSPERFSLMDDVPTMKEQGYDMDATNTFGFVAPAKTPTAILQKLNLEINEVLKRPDVQAAMKAQGVEIFALSQQQYSKYLETELERWGVVIRRAKIKLEN